MSVIAWCKGTFTWDMNTMLSFESIQRLESTSTECSAFTQCKGMVESRHSLTDRWHSACDLGDRHPLLAQVPVLKIWIVTFAAVLPPVFLAHAAQQTSFAAVLPPFLAHVAQQTSFAAAASIEGNEPWLPRRDRRWWNAVRGGRHH